MSVLGGLGIMVIVTGSRLRLRSEVSGNTWEDGAYLWRKGFRGQRGAGRWTGPSKRTERQVGD